MLTKICNLFKMLHDTPKYIETIDNNISINDDTIRSIKESVIIYLPNAFDITSTLDNIKKHLLVKYVEIDRCMNKHVENKTVYYIEPDINNISVHYIQNEFLVILINSENLFIK